MNLTTSIGICNLAWMRLGGKADLASLTGTDKIHNLISVSYDLERDYMLALFPWHFGQKRVELDYVVATISGATQANPVVLSVDDISLFPDGSLSDVTDVDGMTELNINTFFLDNRNTTANTVELFDSDPTRQSDVSGTDTINTHESIDGTSYGAWSANGQLRLVPYGYRYAYTLPSDCLAVTSLITSAGLLSSPYEINLDKFYTNVEDAFIEYSYQITDETTPIFHATFIDCFAWRLAKVWAKALVDDIDVTKAMDIEYNRALSAAQANDARQNPKDYSYNDSFLTARG